MFIYPAIDLYDGKAVRLYKGDYTQMTVYSQNPPEVAMAFRNAGAKRMHLVDLQGAKDGKPANLDVIGKLVCAFAGFVEVGGGIRDLNTVQQYLSIGVDRVILGTAAVNDPEFLAEALERYGEKIAVGVDIKDGYVAIKGWTEKSQVTAVEFLAEALERYGEKIAVGVDIKDGYVAIKGWTEKSQVTAVEFFDKMQAMGVKTIICTDISRDGAMKGTNRELYKALSERYDIDLIASGGVSTMEDVEALASMGIHGAIIGKAYYIGAIDLRQAIEVAR